MPSHLKSHRALVGLALVVGCANASQTPAGSASAPVAAGPAQAASAAKPASVSPAITPPQASAAALTTMAGVYTLDQAKRGADVYAGACQSCHSPASHTGNAFKAGWVGRPLSELYNYLSSEMPQNDPGSLDAQQYADVTAYILRLNSMPTGASELPANADSLTKIQISPAPSSPAVKSPHHQ